MFSGKRGKPRYRASGLHTGPGSLWHLHLIKKCPLLIFLLALLKISWILAEINWCIINRCNHMHAPLAKLLWFDNVFNKSTIPINKLVARINIDFREHVSIEGYKDNHWWSLRFHKRWKGPQGWFVIKIPLHCFWWNFISFFKFIRVKSSFKATQVCDMTLLFKKMWWKYL